MFSSGFISEKPVTLENDQLVSISHYLTRKIVPVEVTFRDKSYATKIIKIWASSSLLSVKIAHFKSQRALDSVISKELIFLIFISTED